MRILPKHLPSLLAIVASSLVAGCVDGAPVTETLAGPDDVSASRSAANCRNFAADGVATLGAIEVAPGVFTVGALPMAVTIAGIPGMLSSVVTGMDASGAKLQGAQHLTLVHTFESPQGTFTTTDRAVCAPAGKNPSTCRVNDVLTVVSGTGVFADAGGSFRNHGTIDLGNWSLTVSLRGRVCGAGL